jgi:hypothetical protein
VTPFFSIATLFLSVAVVVIAWQQWRVAENKLRLDLFERRYKVYEATRTFLSLIAREATFTDAQFMDFGVVTLDAEFFFKPDVAEYLSQIKMRALDMRVNQRLYEDLPQGDERSRHVEAEHDQLIWLKDQFAELPKIFAPYLGFANIRLRVIPPLMRRTRRR